MRDDDFRHATRSFFQCEYPENLRFISRHPKWEQMIDWHTILQKKGWIAPSWPEEFGGMGLGVSKQLIMNEEQKRHGIPHEYHVGVQLIGPLIITSGTRAQKTYWLPRILAGDSIWCLGYSEPRAGSDLLSLETLAIENKNHFVVKGQKRLLNMASDINHILLLLRTQPPSKSKEEGFSLLLVDLDQPNITTHREINSTASNQYCDITFDNVRVSTDNLVGPLNSGWEIAKELLSFERIFVDSPNITLDALRELVGFARSRGFFKNSSFRDRYSLLVRNIEEHSTHHARCVNLLKCDETLRPEFSLFNYWIMETYKVLNEMMREVTNPDNTLFTPLLFGNHSIEELESFFSDGSSEENNSVSRLEIQRDNFSKSMFSYLKQTT